MNSAPIYPNAAVCHRSFAAPAANIDFMAVISGGVDMGACPVDSPPARLLIHHTAVTPIAVNLIGGDGKAFTLTVPGGPAAAVGITFPFDGEVRSFVFAGSGTIVSIVATWWMGSRMPRTPSA